MGNSVTSKSVPPGITVRAAKETETERIMCLLKEEVPGWARVEWFVRSLIEDYPGCILIAENTEKELCGFVSGRPITDNEGLISQFLVRKDLRGRGIGRILLDTALQNLGGRNILLSATPDGFPIYTRRGFKTGNNTFVMLRGQISKEWIDTIQETVDGLEIRNLEEVKVDSLIHYNKNICGIKEEWLFHRHLSQGREAAHIGKAAVLDNQLVGFAFLLMSSGVPILTLYADVLLVAKQLLKSLYEMPNSRNSEPWDFNVPRGNKNAMDIFYQFNNDKLNILELSQMYTKCPISFSLDRIYSANSASYHHC